MREIVLTNQYKRDIKKARKRNLNEEELTEVVEMLANDEVLPRAMRDHALMGNYRGFRECHVNPDWLLVYSKDDTDTVNILNLVRTGTHSDLFSK